MMKALVNSLLLTDDGPAEGKAVIVEGGTVRNITGPENIPAGAERIDCRGYHMVPGFIDLQIAGAGGYLFSSNTSVTALEAITEAIVMTGTTSFLLSLPTNSREVYSQAFEAVGQFGDPALLGLHLEGPYISLAKRGAHSRELIRKPSAHELRELLEEARGTVKMMTVAPEVCTPDIIDLLKEYGVTVAAGHSNATFGEASAGFEMGIETTTHLFNAMSPIHHREPGLPGAVFNSDTAMASIIADGIHVDFSMIAIAKKIMKERLFLVSDAVEENDRGAYQHIRQYDRFTLPDGTLSGANLSMLGAVRNCVMNAGIGLPEAVRMATQYPARLTRRNDIGNLQQGARADILLLDSELELKGLMAGGKLKFIN